MFKIESGKVKSKVTAVLQDDVSLLLVYEDSDAISYIPEKGNTLTIITPDDKEVEVMFLGSQIEWYEDRQQILIFIKVKEQ